MGKENVYQFTFGASQPAMQPTPAQKLQTAKSSADIPTYNIYVNGDANTSVSGSDSDQDTAQSGSREVLSRGLGCFVTQDEVDLLSRVIYGEARGEDFEGQVAVGAVVLNRLVDPHFPKTIEGVIYQPGAFTAVKDQQIHLKPNDEAYQAAEEALAGVDPTDGAIYYYNPKLATDRWIKSRPVIKRIGNHTFSI